MEASSFDNIGFLSSIGGFERYSSFSQPEDCPSMTSSFLTIDTSGTTFDGDRGEHRGSISPENLTVSSGTSVNSPLTPAHLHEPQAAGMWPRYQGQDTWHHHNADVENLWLASDEAVMASCVMNDFPQHDLPMYPPGYFGLNKKSKPTADPPLSRAVFANAVSHQEEHNTVDGMMSWPQRLELAYLPTVAPNVTFQNVMPSSPASEFAPMTPMKHHRYNSSIFASSPLTDSSSSILASQWPLHDEAGLVLTDNYSNRYEQQRLSRSHSSRSYYVDHTDQEGSSPTRKHMSRSGLDCEAVIPQNIFACSVPGCVDKDGKPKRFRRQEHKKRHEKTVHKKDATFPCWVQTGEKPCGKVFTRRDNLNSHLKKTHGSRKNNQRNSYVATLDEKSKYFDEKWKGQLTADGLPIGHPRWPELC